jgi:hypothetical protein
VDDAMVQLRDRVAQGKLIRSDAALKDGEARALERRRKRTGLRHRGVDLVRRAGKHLEQSRRHVWHVRGQDDAYRARRMPQRRRNADDRGACLAPVVEDLERERQRIRRLSDHDHVAEGLREEGVGMLGEDRPAEGSEGLR